MRFSPIDGFVGVACKLIRAIAGGLKVQAVVEGVALHSTAPYL